MKQPTSDIPSRHARSVPAGCALSAPSSLPTAHCPLPTTLPDLKNFLHANVLREYRDWYGVGDGPWVKRAVENYFDDARNYDRRWHVIPARRPQVGRILDVAAGCGTFTLHGLNRGYDVVGIEPEAWKHVYYARKIELSGYDPAYRGRMIAAVGEALPFADASFDLVTTFQTLEHVADVEKCISEMLRVLRPGGVLYLRAPDYNCFFEPHYQLPFLPKMNRAWAEKYLRWLGRPVAGLRGLQWTTERDTLAILRRQPEPPFVERNRYFFIERRRREVEAKLPRLLRGIGAARVLNELHQLKRRASGWLKLGRQERVIDLWITKLGGLALPRERGSSATHSHVQAA
jgi:ubiquinone/menaquinone biosynthesis C-methylase UbiE